MKYIKRYKLFVESLTETDLEVDNQERIYSGEYPNVKVIDEPYEETEQETKIEPSI